VSRPGRKWAANQSFPPSLPFILSIKSLSVTIGLWTLLG
jgi:hypothetical protein